MKPIYVFQGFLDAGKTSAIKSTLLDPNFYQNEKTLIITFEQGDIDYDNDFLSQSNSSVECLDDISLFDELKLNQLDDLYKPDRIFIELNGLSDNLHFFNNSNFKRYQIAQSLCFYDASVIDVQLKNMRQFVYNQLICADTCVFNRCDSANKLSLRNVAKSINRNIEIIFEDVNGNITNQITDELFDISKPIEVNIDDYGLWYMDAYENPDKYNNVEIAVTLKYLDSINGNNNVAIFGRDAMVCCSDDIQPIAIMILNVDINKLELNTYYHLKGKGRVLTNNDGQKTCALEVIEYNQIENFEDKLVTFS